MPAIESFAKMLRVDQDVLRQECLKLDSATGKSGVIDKLLAEHDERMDELLAAFSLSRSSRVGEVYDKLLANIEAGDRVLMERLQKPLCSSHEDCLRIVSAAQDIANHHRDGNQNSFFMKKEVAAEMLRKEPPPKILRALGYRSSAELLAKEDLFEVFAALRFFEDKDWMNKQLFRHYDELQPQDFEQRPIELRVLTPKWREAAKTFVAKKYHNVSHLKELGVIFVIPIALGIPGEVLRMLSLLLHYLHEVPFYYRLFKHFAQTPDIFADRLTSLLRGDVPESAPPPSSRPRWMIVQRYLAKDDPYEWRLGIPHVNPEVHHWEKAEADLARYDPAFSFWQDLDWIGGFFKDEAGVEVLVSSNLIDAVMSLVELKQGMTKHFYHHQEALWNRIVEAYSGREKLEELIISQWEKGYVEI